MRNINLHLSLILLLIVIYNPISLTAQIVDDSATFAELERREKEREEIILLKNEQATIPYLVLEKDKFALITIGITTSFEKRVKDYLEMPTIRLENNLFEDVSTFFIKNNKVNRIIIAIEDSTMGNENYRNLLSTLPTDVEITWVLFSQPTNSDIWKLIQSSKVLLYTVANSSLKQDMAAQILFGGMAATGKLSSSLSDVFNEGDGAKTDAYFRLQYTIPEALHLDGERIQQKVDSIIRQAIEQQAFPGCQILVAIDNKVIFRQSYGYHTYEQRTKVEDYDLYDLASVTKISGPLPLLIHMHSANLIDLDMPFSNYFSDWRRRLFHPSNKDTLTLRQLLAHQGRLTPYLPFWKATKNNGKYKSKMYRFQPIEDYTLEIDDHLFLKDKFKKNVLRTIRKSKLLPSVEYKYSCLPSIVYPSMIEEVTGHDYEEFLYKTIYHPISAHRLVYNPLQKGFLKEEITPTEIDFVFRESLVHGRVHDEAAAIIGGVSGNAGLFSNANDLAKLMQLYLNNGHYAGYQILPRELMQEYTHTQYIHTENRRALGFDKPLKNNSLKSIDKAWPSPGASYSSYGHSGFTGTFVWVDPTYKLLYIFLSNRVYPSREHNALSRLSVRTTIQQLFYDEMERAKEK